MERKKVASRSLMVVGGVVAASLLIGLTVSRARGESSEPEHYQVTIEGSSWGKINGTWELDKVSGANRWEKHPVDDNIVWAHIELGRLREEDKRHWSEEQWPGERWYVELYRHGVDLRKTTCGHTFWIGQEITADAGAEPYQHLGGPFDGGTIVVHKR